MILAVFFCIFLVHETSLNDLTITNTSIYSPIIVTSTAQTDRVEKMFEMIKKNHSSDK